MKTSTYVTSTVDGLISALKELQIDELPMDIKVKVYADDGSDNFEMLDLSEAVIDNGILILTLG